MLSPQETIRKSSQKKRGNTKGKEITLGDMPPKNPQQKGRNS